MNCPIHRRKMDYEPLLSAPNTSERKRVYYCSLCLSLYIFLNKPLKSTIGGVVVMRVGNVKRAGYYEVEDMDSVS